MENEKKKTSDTENVCFGYTDDDEGANKNKTKQKKNSQRKA